MKKSLTILFVFAIAFSCHAQKEPKFTVEVNNDSILLGNFFEVKFILENAQSADFSLPDFSAFNIVGGPNQSSSFSMVNGDVTQEMSYTYFLEPKDVGNFYIEPASIQIEDVVLESQPIEIIVVPNPDGIRQQPKQRKEQKQADDFFKRELDFGFPSTPTTPPSPKKKKKKRKTYRM